MLIINKRALTVDLYVAPGDAHLVLADAVVGTLVLLVPAHTHTQSSQYQYRDCSRLAFLSQVSDRVFSVFILCTKFRK
jgi:hypothetical protein